jgi:hypothetical protein
MKIKIEIAETFKVVLYIQKVLKKRKINLNNLTAAISVLLKLLT